MLDILMPNNNQKV